MITLLHRQTHGTGCAGLDVSRTLEQLLWELESLPLQKCVDYTILDFSVSERSLIDGNKGLYDFYCPRSVLPFPRAAGKVES